MCEMSGLEGLWGKNTDKEGLAGGRLNAQTFSYQIFSFAGKIFVEMHEMYKRGLALASNIESCLKVVKSP